MRMRAALILLVSTVTCVAQNWPSFRGPNGSGISQARGVPVKWSEPLWKTDIPGISHASPVIWGDRVYVVTAIAKQGESKLSFDAMDRVEFAKDQVPHEWRLLCLRRSDGSVLWQRTAHEATPRSVRHVRASYANATPATDGSYVVLTLANEAVVCFDRDGNMKWKHALELSDPKWSLDPAAGPVIWNGTAIVLNDWLRGGYMASYELATGKELWRIPREEGMAWTPPVVLPLASGPELVVNSPRWIRGYDPKTGAELWRFDNTVKDPWDRVPVPIVAGDRIIVAGGGPARPVYAFRAGVRGEIKKGEGLAWASERHSPHIASPLAYDGRLYVMADNGVLRTFSTGDGAPGYQERVAAGATFWASPVAAEGRIYLASDAGDVYTIRAGDKFEVLGTSKLGESVSATPAITDGMLLFRTLTGVVAVGAPARRDSKKEEKKAAVTKGVATAADSSEELRLYWTASAIAAQAVAEAETH